jgi:hypothetical protein
MALEQIEIVWQKDDIELMFEKFRIPSEKLMAIMKLCSLISVDLGKLILLGINYFLSKYGFDPKTLFKEVAV